MNIYMQCVVLCCTVLQCVAARHHSELHLLRNETYVCSITELWMLISHLCCIVMQRVTVCCSVLHRVAAFCIVYIVLILFRWLQYVAIYPHPEFHPEFMYMANLSTGLCSYIK